MEAQNFWLNSLLRGHMYLSCFCNILYYISIPYLTMFWYMYQTMSWYGTKPCLGMVPNHILVHVLSHFLVWGSCFKVWMAHASQSIRSCFKACARAHAHERMLQSMFLCLWAHTSKLELMLHKAIALASRSVCHTWGSCFKAWGSCFTMYVSHMRLMLRSIRFMLRKACTYAS